MNKLDWSKNLRGVYKKWIWGDTYNYSRICDYIQKINYCIQDLNNEIEALAEPTMKEVVYVIVLVDWICEAIEAIQKTLLCEVANNYTYKEEESIQEALRFFKAIRSFVVAHPLSTNRHKDYGFDGDMICVDVRRENTAITRIFSDCKDWYKLDFAGLQKHPQKPKADFVLYVYSKKDDGMQYFKYIGVELKDIYQVAELQIKKLYDLDKYLEGIKKKDCLGGGI